ncbi:MATE family efflux transporter [Phycisphaerae bacterium]|jgi:MATE family multidrug resistance protein|nr:MATE family efflux transporter [Phycisphaerae bacterium]
MPQTHDPSSPHPHPLREMLAIAGPTVATMVSYTLMTFTDKWLCSHIGPDPIYVGAQGNGGLVAWVPISLAHGFLNVVSTFVSQNQGAGKAERGPAYVWNAMYMGWLYWLVFLLPISFMLPLVFRLSEMDPRQAEMATQYGQILLWGAGITMIVRSLGQFFFGMHKPGVMLAAGVSSNIFNLIVSAVLTFGHTPPETLGAFGHFTGSIAKVFNIEAMGITGSAIGTVLATCIEAAIPACVFLGKSMNARYATRAAWRISREHMVDVFKMGWPAGLMFANEMICWALFMVYLVSHFGAEHATAGWIAHQYMSLSFMPAVGLSVAAAALVGKYQGMGRSDIATHRAWLAVKIALVYMGICAIIFLIFREQLIRAFVRDDTDPLQAERLVALGSKFLIATAAFQLFDAAAMTISGALRGAGDTKVPGVATVILSWTIIVGGGFMMIHLFPSLQSVGPWIAAATYIAVLCLFLLFRFLAGHWKDIKVVKD